MIAIVKHNQNLLDIAIQYTNSAETVFIILQANTGLSLTDDLVAGQEIVIPSVAISEGYKKANDDFIKTKKIPATGLPKDTQENQEFLWDSDGYIEDEAGYIK